MSYRIKQLNTGALSVNTWLVINPEEKKAVVIDPGGDADYILRIAKESGATVSAILLTHCHFDHIGGVCELVRLTDVPVYTHTETARLINTKANLAEMMFGLEALPITVNKTFTDGEILDIQGFPFQVIHTPGHSADSCCFLLENALFTGDTLFFRSVGRVDLPTGNGATLLASLREKVFTLPEELVCYPGHGEKTTLRSEKKHNPYLAGF